MNTKTTRVALSLLTTVVAISALAQQPSTATSTPQPSPSAGLVNDFLRKQDDAFSHWDIGGQVRVRFEAKDGFAVTGVSGAVDFSEATPQDNYWLLREKVHLGWKPTAWINLYAEGRDSSSWSDDRTPEPEEDAMDLHQAFLALGDAKQFPLTAKIGRQELSYGEERLVGAFDWNNLGRVFDAAKLRFENDAFWVDAFAGRVVLADDGEFNVSNDYDWFSGLYASTRQLIPKHESQLYFLARNTDAKSPTATTGSPQAGGPTARDIYTVGLRLKSLPGQFHGWDYDLELAGQFGSFYDPALTANLDQQAFAAHVAAGYTFEKTAWKPRLGLEYNFSSGDSDPTDGKHETFDNLFPTNHKFYGFMDFFSWQNMHNVRLSASAKPVNGLTLTADYHLFWLADTADYYYGVSGAARRTGGYGLRPAADSFAGSELNLIASYQLRNIGTAQVGYGHFFRGDYVEQSLAVAGSQDADWFYAQVVFNF